MIDVINTSNAYDLKIIDTIGTTSLAKEILAKSKINPTVSGNMMHVEFDDIQIELGAGVAIESTKLESVSISGSFDIAPFVKQFDAAKDFKSSVRPYAGMVVYDNLESLFPAFDLQLNILDCTTKYPTKTIEPKDYPKGLADVVGSHIQRELKFNYHVIVTCLSDSDVSEQQLLNAKNLVNGLFKDSNLAKFAKIAGNKLERYITTQAHNFYQNDGLGAYSTSISKQFYKSAISGRVNVFNPLSQNVINSITSTYIANAKSLDNLSKQELVFVTMNQFSPEQILQLSTDKLRQFIKDNNDVNLMKNDVESWN